MVREASVDICMREEVISTRESAEIVMEVRDSCPPAAEKSGQDKESRLKEIEIKVTQDSEMRKMEVSPMLETDFVGVASVEIVTSFENLV